jgi:hypothetical protein
VQYTDIKNMDSLLWILFTVVAMMRIYGDCNLTLMLNLLHSVVTALGIHRHEDFTARLAQWPWIGDWHPLQTVHVWTMLTERFDDLAAAAPDAHHLAAPTVFSEPPQRLFLGGLEFFYYH